MKNEKSTPEENPELSKEDIKREEDLRAAAKRRDAYSAIRDQQAEENNDAIARRIERDKNKQE